MSDLDFDKQFNNYDHRHDLYDEDVKFCDKVKMQFLQNKIKILEQENKLLKKSLNEAIDLLSKYRRVLSL